MPTRKQALFALSAVFLAVIVAAAALLFGNDGKMPVPTGIAQVGGPFSLVDQDGKRVTEKDFAGTYMLVFFGYTFCPDVCPTELQVMTQAVEAMGGAGAAIRPVFVTVDPQRDTPEVLKSYVGNFGAGLVGLTGTAAEIAAVTKAYRVAYKKVESVDGAPYLMDHSSIIYLMGPDGTFLKHFTYTTDAKGLAKALADTVAGSS